MERERRCPFSLHTFTILFHVPGPSPRIHLDPPILPIAYTSIGPARAADRVRSRTPRRSPRVNRIRVTDSDGPARVGRVTGPGAA
jgi:hypothetical protein